MQQRFFGTDGIRGRFGEAPLNQATVTAIGRAAGSSIKQTQELPDGEQSLEPATVILAGDTRESTPQLAEWIVLGLRQVLPSVHVRWGNVLPTPAVAYMTRTTDAHLGLVLSASHNPFHDNGIKFFDTNGRKLDDAHEAALEAEILRQLDVEASSPALSQNDADVSTLKVDHALAAKYLQFLEDSFGESLAGLSVVLDTGHGAASALAAPAFSTAGANTHLICAEPDGRNINNKCGSTAPQLVGETVLEKDAHLGFAFDGDADRVIVADASGNVRDGDEILFLWAKTLQAEGQLEPPAIVATSLSNLGLEHALSQNGITVERCDVGDRAVTEMLRARGIRLGGEQSGHIIDSARATTGDGLLTALAIAQIVNQAGKPLSALLNAFRRFPQRLKNVPVCRKPAFEDVPAIAQHARRITEELGTSGRLVLRYSGTEPLARVMVEAEDQATVDRLAADLASTIERELGE